MFWIKLCVKLLHIQENRSTQTVCDPMPMQSMENTCSPTASSPNLVVLMLMPHVLLLWLDGKLGKCDFKTHLELGL